MDIYSVAYGRTVQHRDIDDALGLVQINRGIPPGGGNGNAS
jgi:hypothetical protein